MSVDTNYQMANKINRLSIQILALATFMSFSLFIWQGNKGFSLWDEGFLWYGAQRVMLGEVPIRDFMAYDPGRYYGTAVLMSLWGDNGIMALRGASAIFQSIGIFAGLLLIARNLEKKDFLYLLLPAITFMVWMIMSFKAVDYSASILLISALAFLARSPTRRNYFLVGLCIGLTAIFGRNHGVYGIVGSLGVIFWLNIWRLKEIELIKCFSFWAAGVLTGFIPILLMALLIPGFAKSFWDSILFLFEIKATNLILPIPWPWLVNFNSLPLGEVIRGLLVGLFFIGIVSFGVLSIIWVFWQKFQNKQVPSVLVSSSFLALPYAHYAYSRADVSHLSLGIFPLLVGCFALFATQRDKVRWLLALILSATSIWVAAVNYPGWQCYVSEQCVDVEVSGSHLLVDKATASEVGLLFKLVNQYASNGQSFIATPFWPGAYPLLNRRSPMWELYALFPRTPVFERAEISRIKEANPGFALVFDMPLDGRDELRFRNTHPLIHQYILDNFEPLSKLSNPAYQIYKKKGGAQ